MMSTPKAELFRRWKTGDPHVSIGLDQIKGRFTTVIMVGHAKGHASYPLTAYEYVQFRDWRLQHS